MAEELGAVRPCNSQWLPLPKPGADTVKPRVKVHAAMCLAVRGKRPTQTAHSAVHGLLAQNAGQIVRRQCCEMSASTQLHAPSASAISLIISGSIGLRSRGRWRQALFKAMSTLSAQGWQVSVVLVVYAYPKLKRPSLLVIVLGDQPLFRLVL